MRLRFGIAVAGAHGKTSTTSMIAHLLERAGLDPTAVIGGRLSTFGSNARLGRGDYMVVEADESDGSFLRLSPAIAVITNVDREHMDHYGDFDQRLRGVRRVRQQGAVLRRGDRVRGRPAAARAAAAVHAPRDHLRPRQRRRGPVAARTCAFEGGRSRCRVGAPGGPDAQAEVARATWRSRVPGPAQPAERAGGRRRRRSSSSVPFERGHRRRWRSSAAPTGGSRCSACVDGVTVVDDYGHHPTEIAAVLAAARTLAPTRVVVVFQPHRYTRTQHLLRGVRHGARARRRDRAHRHLRGRRGPDSGRHDRGRGRERDVAHARAGAHREAAGRGGAAGGGARARRAIWC